MCARPSRFFLLAAWAAGAAACSEPQVLLKIHREDAAHPLFLLPCDTCDWTAVFDDRTKDLDRTVGLYFDERSRTVVMRLQRAGDRPACTELSVVYSGEPRVLGLTLPSDEALPPACETGACPAAAACGVSLLAAGCDAPRCPAGCCDAKGACWTARTDTACGRGGQACKDCQAGAGTCQEQRICSQDCGTSNRSCDAANPCCDGLVCHQGACVMPSFQSQPCDEHVPCVDGLTCNDTRQGGYCGKPLCQAAGATCLVGDFCCNDEAACDERCCFASGHSCGQAAECCGGDCWNGCNPRSWVEGCLSPTCQSTETCVGRAGHCDPDRNDCCRPYRCFNTQSDEFPDYECWEHWPP